MRSKHPGCEDKAFGPGADSLITVDYQAHSDALNALKQVVETGTGFGLLLGPRFSGKCVLARQLAMLLRSGATIFAIDGSTATPQQIVLSVLSGLDCKVDPCSTSEILDIIRVTAAHQARSDAAPILLVEHVDRMAPDALHILCKLAELSTAGEAAIRIVLTGRTHSGAKLISKNIADASYRNLHVVELGAMSRQESTIYLYARLRASGHKHPEGIFPIEVCDRLYEQSGGWPGILNRYAMRAIARSPYFPVSVSDTFERTRMKPEWRTASKVPLTIRQLFAAAENPRVDIP